MARSGRGRALPDVMRLITGGLSHKVQREYPDLGKRNWGRRGWVFG